MVGLVGESLGGFGRAQNAHEGIPGIHEEGGTFRVHRELASLTIASKRRVLGLVLGLVFVLVLPAVEHAQMDDGTNPVANFVSTLQEGERGVKGLEPALSSVLLHLSALELKRNNSPLHPVSTPGEVGTPKAVHRLRNFGDDLNVGANQPTSSSRSKAAQTDP